MRYLFPDSFRINDATNNLEKNVSGPSLNLIASLISSAPKPILYVVWSGFSDVNPCRGDESSCDRALNRPSIETKPSALHSKAR